MASFTPLNIIPDSDSEGEVDNTQEIQIEEALKLYQQALRLHTDHQWEEAQKTYEELFQSEIFQLDVEEQVHGRNSNAASSLPLVHYLSFKNQGAFKLDRLKASMSTQSETDVRTAVTQALEWFATALGRDAGDTALWRQSAQLAVVLSSARLARFALESVLDHETVGADASKDTLSHVAGGNPNPEDHLASLQLQKILEKLDDNLSMCSDRFKGLSGRRLNRRFAKFLNPVPWLEVPKGLKPLAAMIDQFSERRKVTTVTSRTWAAVGKAIFDLLPGDGADIEEVVLQPQPDTLQIVLPLYEGEEESRDTTPDEPSPQEFGSKLENAAADDNEDISMTDASATLAATSTDRRRSASANRKRKSTSMGIDVTDTGRSRLSKRQRDKKAADAAAAEAAASTPESRAKVRQDTQDEKLFNTIDDCFSPFGLSLGNAAALKINFNPDAMDMSDNGSKAEDKCDLYLDDFKMILQTWDDDKGNVILYGDGIQSPAEAAQGMSFLDLEANIPNRPLLAGDEGLRKWARGVNMRGLCVSQAAFEWLKALCKRDVDPRNKKSKNPSVSSGQSSWAKHNWPDFLKAAVLSTANKCEEICFQYFKDVIQELDTHLCDGRPSNFTADNYADVEFAEAILELYLDDLAATERDRSGGDINNDVELGVKRERVLRWTYLVGDLMHHRPRNQDGQLEEDQLTLRYLWASAVVAGFTGNSSREFRLACFEDLKVLLAERGPPIDLPNSGVMPEISAARAEREISKLKTVDFFSSTIFAAASETSERDPENVIDILEAVLEPGAVLPYDEEEERMLHEIGRFLDGSSAMFKLHLWEKLRAAYEKADNRPKVFSCTLKCIQVVMSELKSRSYIDSSQDHRQFVLLRSLRLVKGMITNALTLSRNEANIAALADQELIDALGSLLPMLRILHCYAFWESAVIKSEAKASDLHSYRLVVMKFKELLVQGWIMAYLLYAAMLNRGMGSENEEGWDEDEKEDKLVTLFRDLHDELGSRHYCKMANHLFLRLMFDELLKFNKRDYDCDLLQVIHCRFHLTLCSDQWYVYEHKTVAEPLDKGTALRLIDFIMYQASRKRIMQLQKSDLKVALDKLVEIFGIKPENRPTRIAHNYAVIDTYLKSTLHPLKLIGCLKGDLDISTVEIFGEQKEIASKGLFFLQGKIALFQLKNTKRICALKTDELDSAVRYLRHDLACNPDSWETWYRMGQTYEVQMDDAQTWNSEHMNSKRPELVHLERRTILCYMMAVALAVKNLDDSPETLKVVSELCTDFGYRIYSSCRPPMASESFWTDGHERHFSGRYGRGMYTANPHSELGLPAALRFALTCFQRALALPCGGDNWKNHYMIGKCKAKLLEYRDYDVEEILEHFVEAIKQCPEKSNEIIFEPHHKLISATTKFVIAERLEPKCACEILQASRFSKGIEPVTDSGAFVPYALEVLKKMKAADKQKWHHRMTNRIARLRFTELDDVAGARAEISSLFNKAAHPAIWRPDHERPGRHYVFVSQYTMFYVELLEKLGDRATLEMLAKRVRRIPNGLYRHPEIWSFVFDKYISVLRHSVPWKLEEDVFRDVSFDEFSTYSQKLDTHCNALKDSQCPPALDTLREVFELRRLNAGLAKNSFIDELLADSYALLWKDVVPAIVDAENEKQLNPMSLKNMMFDPAPPPPPPPPPPTTTAAAPVEVSVVKMEGGMAGKLDLDLPLRAKMTRVTRRELISKATNLCKEMNQAPAAATGKLTAPSQSPKLRAGELQMHSDDGATTMEEDSGAGAEFGAGMLPPGVAVEE